jgi:hemerythrin
MAISWDDRLLTGVTEIDNQHKEIFTRVNKFLDACKGQAGKSEVEDTIKFLGDYCIKHFNNEEIIQKQYGYPDMTNHIAAHTEFKNKFTELKARFDKEGPTIGFKLVFNTAVIEWLIQHIKGNDRKVADFIKNK